MADKEEEKKGRGKREKGEKEGGERETEKEKEMTVVALPSMIDCDRKWWAVCRKLKRGRIYFTLSYILLVYLSVILKLLKILETTLRN